MTKNNDKIQQSTALPGTDRLTLCRTYTLAQFDIRFQHRLLDPQPLRTPAELARELVREGFIELRLDPVAAPKGVSNKVIVVFAKDCLFMLEEEPKLIQLEERQPDA